MNKKIDFNDVPENYLYSTYNKCPRRNECLRHQATLRIPQNVPDFRTVNPNHIIGNENNCSFFKPYRTSRFACGIDHILDNIPYSTAVIIRKELYSLMGRSMFYRIRNKERMLHPDEQKQIIAVFLKHGIENKPEFDQYIDLFDW